MGISGFYVGCSAAVVVVTACVTVGFVNVQMYIAQNGAQNGCVPNPCENGGTCTRDDRLGSFTCTCLNEYTGSTCSDDNVFCTSNPCQNGGTCAELYPGYSCTCISGYAGTHCEIGNFSLLQSKLNLVNTTGTYEGFDVALSGDGLRLAQGAYSYDAPVSAFGMFSVYSRSAEGENFTDESGLLQGATGGTNETGTNMGRSLALDYDGDTLVVGGYGDGASNEGAVWVFTRTGSTWTQQGAKITPGVASNTFGQYCDVSDDGNALAASAAVSGVGEVHVYTRSGETWSPHPSNPIRQTDGVNPSLVTCLELSGDGRTLVAGFHGADNDGADAGAVWVFVDNGTDWVQQGAYINASISAAGKNFGTMCDISYDGDAIAVGILDNSGAAVVYSRTDAVWEEVAVVRATTPEAGDYFTEVALSANATVLAVGAIYAGASDYGVVEVFASADLRDWIKVGSDLEPTGNIGIPNFGGEGLDVDADGSVVAVGGWNDDSQKGAVWVFSNE